MGILEAGILPAPTQQQLLMAAGFAVFLFLAAVFLEMMRRRREERLRLDAEWRHVDQLARDRDVPPRQLRFLKSFLGNHAPLHPLRAATTRQEFNRCVEEDIREVASLDDGEALEERGLVLRDLRVALGLDYIPFGQRIHSTRELYLNQVVWVAVEGDWQRMVVVEVDEAHFRLQSPEKGALRGPRPGAAVRCRMWREEDARYVFEPVLARIDEARRTWVLRHTTSLERLQARAHFRVKFERSAEVGILNAPVDGDLTGVEAREPVTTLRGQFSSLSAGGFAVVVSQPVPAQVLLRVSLDLKDGKPVFDATARLVGSAQLSAGRYLLRGAFVAISDEARERISQYAFRRQQIMQTIGRPGEGVE